MSKPIALCSDIDLEFSMFNLHLLRVENHGGRIGYTFDT